VLGFVSFFFFDASWLRFFITPFWTLCRACGDFFFWKINCAACLLPKARILFLSSLSDSYFWLASFVLCLLVCAGMNLDHKRIELRARSDFWEDPWLAMRSDWVPDQSNHILQCLHLFRSSTVLFWYLSSRCDVPVCIIKDRFACYLSVGCGPCLCLGAVCLFLWWVWGDWRSGSFACLLSVVS
jgi:hypothetical protein